MATPVYIKIAEALSERRQDLRTPLALPDEPALARQYSVARETIRRSLRHLEEQGGVSRKRGVGTFLQPLRPQSDSLKGKHIGVAPPMWLHRITDSRYAAAIYEGISQWTEGNECFFTILPSFEKKMDENTWLKQLHRRNLAGIVWIQPQERQLGLIDKTAKLFPTVILGRNIPGKNLHCISPDYEKAAQLVDRHLEQAGNMPYALVGKNILDPYTHEWMDGFVAAHAKRGRHFDHGTHFVDYKSFNDQNLGRLLLDFYLPFNPEVKALMFLSSGYLHWALTDQDFRNRMATDLSVVTMDYSHYPIESFLPGRTVTHISCHWVKMAVRAMENLALMAANHEVCPLVREDIKLVKGNTVYPAKH